MCRRTRPPPNRPATLARRARAPAMATKASKCIAAVGRLGHEGRVIEDGIVADIDHQAIEGLAAHGGIVQRPFHHARTGPIAKTHDRARETRRRPLGDAAAHDIERRVETRAGRDVENDAVGHEGGVQSERDIAPPALAIGNQRHPRRVARAQNIRQRMQDDAGRQRRRQFGDETAVEHDKPVRQQRLAVEPPLPRNAAIAAASGGGASGSTSVIAARRSV